MATLYHRQARETPAYAWWRLPVAGVLTVVFYLGLSVVLIAGAAIFFAVRDDGTSIEDWLDAAGDLDLTRLDFFVLDMLGLVVLIPAVLLAVLATGPRPVGYLSSVAGRLRWGWLGRTTVMSFVVFGATIGGALAFDVISGDELSLEADDTGQVVLAVVAVLLIVPFQAAAEEYVFRGYLLQLVGSWTRLAVVPVVVSTPLFVAGHAYELWGMVDVGIFGLTAAILTIRTGGLEAAIAAHTANNVVLLVLDALGVVSATDDSGAGPVDLVPTVVSSLVLLVWVEWAVRRHGIQTTREPIAPPPPPPAPMWPPPPWGLPQDVLPWAGQPAPVVAAAPVAPVAPRPVEALHPQTPPYPGEIDERWRR